MTEQTSQPLTEGQLNEIAARAAAATPGPWEEHTEYGPHFYAYLRGPYLRGVGTLNFGDGEDAEADREFVLHARQDVPALLAEVRRQCAELEHLRKSRDAFRDQRNSVFATNERLHAEVLESDQARLLAENETRTVRRELAEQQGEIAKLIRWHGEDDAALGRMRDTIVRLRAELAEAASRG